MLMVLQNDFLFPCLTATQNTLYKNCSVSGANSFFKLRQHCILIARFSFTLSEAKQSKVSNLRTQANDFDYEPDSASGTQTHNANLPNDTHDKHCLLHS